MGSLLLVFVMFVVLVMMLVLFVAIVVTVITAAIVPCGDRVLCCLVNARGDGLLCCLVIARLLRAHAVAAVVAVVAALAFGLFLLCDGILGLRRTLCTVCAAIPDARQISECQVNTLHRQHFSAPAKVLARPRRFRVTELLPKRSRGRNEDEKQPNTTSKDSPVLVFDRIICGVRRCGLLCCGGRRGRHTFHRPDCPGF